MKIHFGTGNGFHAVLPVQIDGPARGDAESAMDEHGTLERRPAATQAPGANLLPQDNELTEDSPMITAIYEAHLSMEKMLAAFAELRANDAEGTIG